MLRRTAIATFATTAMLLAACGSGDDEGDDGAAPAPPSEEAADPSLCPVDALDAADGPVEITFWHSMTASAETTLGELIDDYNASQDRVVVRPVFKGGYVENLEAYRAAVRGGEMPNLVQLEETVIQELIDSQSVIPASACVEAADFDTSDILPRVLDEFTVEDTLWPVPFNTSNPVLYYNKKDFTEAGLDPEAPPATLADIKTASQAIVDSGAANQGYAMEQRAWYVEQLFATSGEQIVNENTGGEGGATEGLRDPQPGEAGVTRTSEMLGGGHAITVGRKDGGQDALLAIASGDAAMTLGTSGALGSVYDVIESNPDLAAGVEIGIAPMPSISGGGEGSTNVGGAALWLADTGDDAQKAASWDFAAWLTQPEQQARWHIGTGYVPISEAAAEAPEVAALWAERPGFRVAFDQLAVEDGPAGPVIGGYAGFREALNIGDRKSTRLNSSPSCATR